MTLETTKTVLGIRYHTASHPKIKEQYKKSQRPQEFGNKVWATTFVVLNKIKDQEKTFKNMRVLEIGCGWGLISIFLAKKYSCKVTASDFDKSVLPLVKIQAKENHVNLETKVAGFHDFSKEDFKKFDIIIGSEVCYSEEVAKDLIQLIGRAISSGVKKIILADPGRPDFKEMIEELAPHYKIETEILPGSINGKQTFFVSISKK